MNAFVSNLINPNVIMAAFFSAIVALLLVLYDVQSQNERAAERALAFQNSLDAEVSRTKRVIHTLITGRLLAEVNKRPDDRLRDMKVTPSLASVLLRANKIENVVSIEKEQVREMSLDEVFGGLPAQLLNGTQIAKGRRDALRLGLSSITAPVFMAIADSFGKPIVTEPIAIQPLVAILFAEIRQHVLASEASKIKYIYVRYDLQGREAKILLLVTRVFRESAREQEIVVVALDREAIVLQMAERMSSLRGVAIIDAGSARLFGHPRMIQDPKNKNSSNLEWVSNPVPLESMAQGEYLPKSATIRSEDASSKSIRQYLMVSMAFLVLAAIPMLQAWIRATEVAQFNDVRAVDAQKILSLQEQLVKAAQSASECSHDIRNQLQRFNVNLEAGAQVLGRIRLLQSAIEGKPFSRIPIYAAFFIRMANSYGVSLSNELSPKLKIDHRLLVDPNAQDAFVLCDPSAVESILINLTKNAVEAVSAKYRDASRYSQSSEYPYIEYRLSATQNIVRFEIKDSGPGISDWNAALAGVSTKRNDRPANGLSSSVQQAESMSGSLTHELNDAGGALLRLELEQAVGFGLDTPRLRWTSSDHIVVVDDEAVAADMWEKKRQNKIALLNVKDPNVFPKITYLQPNDLKRRLVEETEPGTLFLIDYHFPNEQYNGLDLILEHKLTEKAYLVTGAYDVLLSGLSSIDIRKHKITIIPKSYLEYVELDLDLF